jgi:hypothetical protein
MFVKYCEKHKPQVIPDEILGERVVRVATESIDEFLDCPDCEMLSVIMFDKPS